MPHLSTARLVALWLGFSVWIPAVWGQSSALSLKEIVGRMEAAQAASREHEVAYSVTRVYVLSDTDPRTPDSQVTAQVNFVPPGEKAYTLGTPQGGDRVEKVVRKVLDHETEMTAHADRGSITSRNYEFASLGEDAIQGHRCYVLQLKPKREAPELVRGSAWVDEVDYRVRRIEGQLTKSPSWWVKDVHVAINYGDVLGTWVQLDSRADADVRWMGKYILTSQALDLRTQALTANRKAGGQPLRARRSVANSAVWIAR